MIIKVTKEHIEKGITCSCSRCPVAIAINDAIGGRSWVSGHIVFLSNSRLSYNLPQSVVEFIINYDRGIRGNPFNFELDYAINF